MDSGGSDSSGIFLFHERLCSYEIKTHLFNGKTNTVQLKQTEGTARVLGNQRAVCYNQ